MLVFLLFTVAKGLNIFSTHFNLPCQPPLAFIADDVH